MPDSAQMDEIRLLGCGVKGERCCSFKGSESVWLTVETFEVKWEKAALCRPSSLLRDPIYPLLPAFDYHLSSPASLSFQLNNSQREKCKKKETLKYKGGGRKKTEWTVILLWTMPLSFFFEKKNTLYRLCLLARVIFPLDKKSNGDKDYKKCQSDFHLYGTKWDTKAHLMVSIVHWV